MKKKNYFKDAKERAIAKDRKDLIFVTSNIFDLLKKNY